MKSERQIKKEIRKRAEAIATEAYEKEVMFRSLTTSDLHYAIIEDLIKAANLTGSVEIKMADGAIITIKGKDEREELNRSAQNLF